MKAWGIAILCALLFAGIAWWAPMEGTTALDRTVKETLGGQAGANPSAMLLAVNGLGSTAVFAAVTLIGALLAWLMRFRKEAMAIIGTVVLALLVNTGLKALFERARPTHEGWITVDGYSFPSGNSMVGMALYGILIVVVWNCARSGWARWTAVLAGALLIVLIGYSRLYFGVHYATDILAGYAAGLCCVAAMTGAFNLSGSTYSRRRRRSYPSFP
ncbi:undecaprenyl-diphosphatase [Paenibacillus sp. UNCCL117]|uniref:phosphatase PAP2 family protein n=1 Tax=unclassified Paenibacillus TaxID=185978 RepID=UPI00088AAF45|nr:MULTISPECIES: phosphatase PAP2 family protein [unclassified Paenibacillus]SDD48539.1 undecaprenyl-diphosphatase [Paenibacillus sp. cl123]SFW50229.1 undecaprenyl-diphosphatase [Paenibacillus sp. UNCCL117]